MKKAFLALALAGCATLGASRFNHVYKNDSVTAAWGLFTSLIPPPDLDQIEFIYPPRLDCNGGHGFMTYVGNKRECVSGYYQPKDGTIKIAVGLYDHRMSDTAMVHELYHRYLYWTTGDPNSEHKGDFVRVVNQKRDELYRLGF